MDTSLINFSDIGSLLKSPPPVMLSIAIWAILQAVKQIKGFRTELLPLIAITCGAIGFPILVGFSGAAILQGIMIGALPTAIDQVFRQRAKAQDQILQSSPRDPTPPPPPTTPVLMIIGSLFWGALAFGTAQACATQQQHAILVSTNTLVITNSPESIAEVARAMQTGAEIAIREAVRTNDPSMNDAIKELPSRLESLASSGATDLTAIKAVAGTSSAPLSDILALYGYWRSRSTQQDSSNFIFAIASGVRAGIGE